jgi:hypothetical protein
VEAAELLVELPVVQVVRIGGEQDLVLHLPAGRAPTCQNQSPDRAGGIAREQEYAQRTDGAAAGGDGAGRADAEGAERWSLVFPWS